MFSLRIFNNLKQHLKAIQSQKNLLNMLQKGDLVWAKMPLTKKELSKIANSHRIRPYLVIKKETFNCYVFQSSSKSSNRLNNLQEYCIHKKIYKQNKDSFINLTQVYKIPFYNLLEKASTLNNIDLSNIEKRLLAQNKKSEYNFAIDIYISEGDIIKVEKQLYYVYASDNGYLYCLIIFKKPPIDEEVYTPIIINKKTYYTTFKNKMQFKRKNNFNIINIANKLEIEEILKKKKEVEFQQKQLLKLSLSKENKINKTAERVLQKRNNFKTWKK